MYSVLLLKTKASRFSFEALKNKDFIKVSANIFACSCQWILQKKIHQSEKGKPWNAREQMYFLKYRLFK